MKMYFRLKMGISDCYVSLPDGVFKHFQEGPSACTSKPSRFMAMDTVKWYFARRSFYKISSLGAVYHLLLVAPGVLRGTRKWTFPGH